MPASAAAPEPAEAQPQLLKQTGLSDLPEKNVSVPGGHFGKHGSAGAAPGGIMIQAVASHFGIGWQAEGHVEYSLRRQVPDISYDGRA